MQSSVVIKGSKAGMTVILNPDVPFEQLIEDIGKKFRESSRFWGSIQMTLTLEGRTLTPSEEFQIVDAITANSQIDILCILDTDANRIAKCEKALTERLMELSSQTGQFYEASIVIIGDVCHGARVIAKGNVIVLGVLNGTVHAGAAGGNAVIVAFDMAPTQLRIADYCTRAEEKGKRLGRGPIIVSVEEDSLVVRQIKKSFLNYLNFI